MLDPGKSWLPEATSLNQALVKCRYCSSTAAGMAMPRSAAAPGGPEGWGEWSPGHLCWRNLARGGSGLERSGLPDPLCLSSLEFQTGALAGCLADTQQTPTRLARMVAAALQSLSALGPRAGKQGHSNPAGLVLTVPAREGRAMSPRHLDSIEGLRSSRQCWPQSIPGGQKPMGRAHFAQKEEAKSRGEGYKAKSPLAASTVP